MNISCGFYHLSTNMFNKINKTLQQTWKTFRRLNDFRTSAGPHWYLTLFWCDLVHSFSGSVSVLGLDLDSVPGHVIISMFLALRNCCTCVALRAGIVQKVQKEPSPMHEAFNIGVCGEELVQKK